jgi:hypothetical protein
MGDEIPNYPTWSLPSGLQSKINQSDSKLPSATASIFHHAASLTPEAPFTGQTCGSVHDFAEEILFDCALLGPARGLWSRKWWQLKQVSALHL